MRRTSGGSAEPVGVHDLQLAQDFTPVSQRHSPFFGNLMRCKIQSLQERCIARKYTSLLIQTAIAAVKALNGVGGVNDLPDVGGELKNWRYYVPVLVPTLHSIGIIVFPFFCDTVEGFQSSVLGRRMIYRFQVVCELLLVFLSDVFLT